MGSAQRTNGLCCPWSFNLCFAFLVVIVDALIFLALAPTLIKSKFWSLIVIFSLTWLGLVVCAIVVMSKDPADPSSLAPEHRRSRQDDATANLRATTYCPRCVALVCQDSKHCWTCDKCVIGFDHHCSWLNTCIGVKNYRSFIATVIALLAMETTLVASMVIVASAERNREWPLRQIGVGRALSYSLLISMLWLHVLLLMLNCGLLSFHAFLSCHGITTYQWIKGERPKKDTSEQICHPSSSMSASLIHTPGRKQVEPKSSPSPPDQVLRSVSPAVTQTLSEYMLGAQTAATPWDEDEMQVARRRSYTPQGNGPGWASYGSFREDGSTPRSPASEPVHNVTPDSTRTSDTPLRTPVGRVPRVSGDWTV